MMRVRELPLEYKLYLITVFYCLYAIRTVKIIGMPKIDGLGTNNVIVLTFIIFIVVLRRKKYKMNKAAFLLYGLLFAATSLYGAFIVDDFRQFLYAFMQFMTPLLFLLIDEKQSEEAFFSMLDILNIFMVVYAIVGIYLSFKYAALFHVTTSTVGSISRIPMPLGSSMTLSYYMNITLPLPLLLFLNTKKRNKRCWYLLSVVLNVAVTFLQLSRSAAITTIIIVIYFVLFVRKENNNKKKIVLAILLIGIVFYLFSKYDLSRLTISVFGNASGFDYVRYDALDLAVYLFSNNIFLGTGFGAYFHRAWIGNNHLVVNGVQGLVDPHNAVLLLLSEAGIIGFILFVALIWTTVKKIVRIQNKTIRQSGYMLLIALFMNAIAGSQIINEINYACIAVIYLVIFAGQYGKQNEQ